MDQKQVRETLLRACEAELEALEDGEFDDYPNKMKIEFKTRDLVKRLRKKLGKE